MVILLLLLQLSILGAQNNCPQGKFWTGQNCRLCAIEPCFICDFQGGCSVCFLDYVLNAQNICIPCPQSCTYCSSNKCQGCRHPCSECGYQGCTQCVSNQFYVSPITHSCESCPPHCPTCDTNTCLTCLAPCMTCDKIKCLSCAQANQFPSSTTCQDCPMYCTTCSAEQCFTCQIGYHIVSQTCVSCPNHCSECDSTSCTCKPPCSECNFDACMACATGYFLDAINICVQCPSHCPTCDVNTCLTCQSPCLECDHQSCRTCELSNQYALGTTCEYCPAHCRTCDKDRCYTCEPPCSTCDHWSCQTCTQMSQYVSGNVCKSCKDHCLWCTADQCTLCKPPCQTCDFHHCFTCLESNYYMIQNSCQACPGHCLTCDSYTCQSCLHPCETCDHLQCITCALENQYAHQDSCLDCPSHCLTCNRQTCFTCKSPCSTCDFYSCLSCELKSQYIDGVQCLQCPAHCESCDAFSCFTCVAPCLSCSYERCLTCQNENQYTLGPTCIDCPSHCLSCDQKKCFDCQYPCKTCDHSSCTSCELSNYFVNTTNCEVCPDHCLTCNREQCFTCLGNCRQCDLTSCIDCVIGFYPIGSDCRRCPENCQICSQSGCIQCEKDYVFENQGCAKEEVSDANNTFRSCGNLVLDEAEECDDGNSINGDGCDYQCHIERGFICLRQECILKDVANESFAKPEISVSYSNSITVDQFLVSLSGFSRPNCSQVQLSIDRFKNDDYQFTVVSQWSNGKQFQCSMNLKIFQTLTASNTLQFRYVENGSGRLLLDKVPDVQAEASIIPRRVNYLDYNQQQTAIAISSGTSDFLSSLLIVGPLTASFGGFNFFWSILDILAWVNNFYFFNVNYPFNVEAFFISIEWGDLIVVPSFYTFEANRETPPKFMRKNIGPVFFNNIQMLISMLILTVICLTCSKILICFTAYVSRYYKAQKTIRITKQPHIFSLENYQTTFASPVEVQRSVQLPYILNLVNQKARNFSKNSVSNSLSDINLAILDLTQSIILQLKYNQQNLINSILASSSTILCVALIYFSSQQISKHHLILTNPKYLQKFGSLYDEIQTKKRAAILFAPLTLVKKIGFIALLILFYENPLLQSSFCALIQAPSVIFLLLLNPFSNVSTYIRLSIPEFCLFSILVHIILLCVDDQVMILSENVRIRLGWSIIIHTVLTLSLQVAFMLIEFFKRIVLVLKQYLLPKDSK